MGHACFATAPPAPSPDTKPSILAAVVMLAREILRDCGRDAWPQTDTEAMAVLGAGRSYEMLGRLRIAIGTLCGQPGRPSRQEPPPDAATAVTRAVRDFVFAYPGAVKTGPARACYSDAFRRFVLDLRPPRARAGTRATFAAAVGIPADTLDDWLRHPTSPQPGPPRTPVAEGPDIRRAHLATILARWPDWIGTFKAFCASLREQDRIPYGPLASRAPLRGGRAAAFIGTVLVAGGLRQRRQKRPVEAPWNPGTFRTLFPGAHGIGDGTPIAFWVNGHPYVFNAEPIVDVASNAIVAFDVTDTEDQQAVLDAHPHGIQPPATRRSVSPSTTGPPTSPPRSSRRSPPPSCWLRRRAADRPRPRPRGLSACSVKRRLRWRSGAKPTATLPERASSLPSRSLPGHATANRASGSVAAPPATSTSTPTPPPSRSRTPWPGSANCNAARSKPA